MSFKRTLGIWVNEIWGRDTFFFKKSDFLSQMTGLVARLGQIKISVFRVTGLEILGRVGLTLALQETRCVHD